MHVINGIWIKYLHAYIFIIIKIFYTVIMRKKCVSFTKKKKGLQKHNVANRTFEIKTRDSQRSNELVKILIRSIIYSNN